MEEEDRGSLSGIERMKERGSKARVSCCRQSSAGRMIILSSSVSAMNRLAEESRDLRVQASHQGARLDRKNRTGPR